MALTRSTIYLNFGRGAGEPHIDLSAAGGIEVIAAGAPRETAAPRSERRSRTK